MVSAVETDHLTKHVELALRSAIETALNAEIERTVERVRTEIRKQTGNIVLSVLKQYEVLSNHAGLVIRVKNET